MVCNTKTSDPSREGVTQIPVSLSVVAERAHSPCGIVMYTYHDRERPRGEKNLEREKRRSSVLRRKPQENAQPATREINSLQEERHYSNDKILILFNQCATRIDRSLSPGAFPTEWERNTLTCCTRFPALPRTMRSWPICPGWRPRVFGCPSCSTSTRTRKTSELTHPFLLSVR